MTRRVRQHAENVFLNAPPRAPRFFFFIERNTN
jgi:hypothetical protein